MGDIWKIEATLKILKRGIFLNFNLEIKEENIHNFETEKRKKEMR